MTEENFNDLSPAQTEALAVLAEECAEVIQVVGKILRHGLSSKHPADPKGLNNLGLLHEGAFDVSLIQLRLACTTIQSM